MKRPNISDLEKEIINQIQSILRNHPPTEDRWEKSYCYIGSIELYIDGRKFTGSIAANHCSLLVEPNLIDQYDLL